VIKTLTFISLLFITSLIISNFSTAYTKKQVQYTFKVGVYDNEPLVFKSREEEYKGIYIDILTYIAENENWELEFVEGTWNETYSALLSNDIDIMTGIAYSAERTKYINFSNETLLLNWGTVVSRKSLKIRHFFDLEGLKVGVLPNDIYFDYSGGIKEILSKFQINCTYQEYSDYKEIIKGIQNEEIDTGVVNRIFYQSLVDKRGLRETNLIFQPVQLHYAFNKNNSNKEYLIEKIDQYLLELKKDKQSVYYSILDEYLNPKLEQQMSWWGILIISFSVGVSVISIAAFIFFRYKNKIELKESRTRHKELVSILLESYDQLEILIDRLRNQLQLVSGNLELLETEDIKFIKELDRLKLTLDELDSIFYTYVREKKQALKEEKKSVNN